MIKNPSVTGAQTVRRAVLVLKLIAAGGAEGMRLVDIAAELGLERPTAHRLLKTLEAEGMLTQRPDTRRYALGSLLFELGLHAAHPFNLIDLCRPLLRNLAEETGDTSFLFVRSGNDAVCLSRVQGTYPIQTPAVPVGSRQPLGVNAGGLALLSALSLKEVREITSVVSPRLSTYGELSADQIIEHWTRAQETGYAQIGNRAVPGVTAVGLPVISETGLPIAALTVAATNSRMTNERIIEILPYLRAASETLARQL